MPPTLLLPSRTPALPPVDDLTRRGLLRGVGALGAGWVLAACGTSDDAGPETAGDTRTVEHVAGTTDVPVQPVRVIGLGGVAASLILLGLTPAAASDDLDAALDPVQRLLPDDLDLAAIPRFGEQYEPDLEAVAAAGPDLIVGTEFDEERYERLSEIAPTVLVEFGRNGGWRARFLAVADAVGRSEQAAEVEAGYEQVLSELPEAIREVTVAFIRPDADGQFRLENTADAFPGSVAADAGIAILQAPEGVGEFEQGAGFVTVSGELLDLIADADLIVVPDFRALGDDADGVTQFQANPLWANLPAVRAGRVLQVAGLVYNGGNHYAAEQLLGELAEAVA